MRLFNSLPAILATMTLSAQSSALYMRGPINLTNGTAASNAIQNGNENEKGRGKQEMKIERILPKDDYTRPCDTFELDSIVYCKRNKNSAIIPIVLSNLSEFPQGDDPVNIAERYLVDNAEFLFPDLHEGTKFVYYYTYESQGCSTMTIRFKQTVDGYDIYGESNVAVTLLGGEVKYLTSTYQPVMGYNNKVSKILITEADAQNAALDALGILAQSKNKNLDPRLQPKFTNSMKLFPQLNSDTTIVVYHVIIQTPLLETPVYEALVDVETGAVIKLDSLIHDAAVKGDGYVFNPDPLTPTKSQYTTGLDNNDKTSAFYDNARVKIELKDITKNGNTYSLIGPYAQIVDEDSPFNGLFEQSSPDFLFDRSEDAFEAVNCYYHIDTMMRWVNVDLELNINPTQYSGGVKFDPSGANGGDNSYYSGSSEFLAFGEGGVDDGEDADVIIHELGHGLHDWVTGKQLSQVNGLSEGVGDYLAVSYKRSLGLISPSSPEYNWVFGWDGHNEFWGGRIVNYDAKYPDGLVSQVHADGQIWATCNIRVWDAIGRRKTDKIMFQGLSMTNSNTNQNGAANALFSAAKIDPDITAEDVEIIRTIYEECGYTLPTPTKPPTPTVSPAPTVDCVNLKVVVKTDAWPGETSWEVKHSTTGKVVLNQSAYPSSPEGTLWNKEACIPWDCYEFQINDSYGDGFADPGYVEVFYDDVSVFYTGSVIFTELVSDVLGICATGSPTGSPAGSPTSSPTSSPTGSPIGGPTPTTFVRFQSRLDLDLCLAVANDQLKAKLCDESKDDQFWLIDKNGFLISKTGKYVNNKLKLKEGEADSFDDVFVYNEFHETLILAKKTPVAMYPLETGDIKLTTYLNIPGVDTKEKWIILGSEVEME